MIRQHLTLIVILLGSMCFSAACGLEAIAAEATAVAPLTRAHAHNDYLHDRPLLDALDNGFCSVEADIFLVDNDLLVAHTRAELSPERTLKKLYLDPLRERVKKNGGRVYPDGPEFVLLIDIKSNGEETFARLHEMLKDYSDVFSSTENGKHTQRAVTAIISGNRPQEMIAKMSPRFAGIDGRLSDLDSDQPANLLPLISDNWRLHFRWRGEGEMPSVDREKLTRVVKAAHDKKRKIRFWAIPDNAALWQAMNDAKVDLINTDDLPGLRKFLERSE